MNKEEKVENIKWNNEHKYCNKDDVDFLLNLIQKQSEIIDKMAEYIKDLDLDESICIENTINPQLCNEQLSNCKECIKEYFKKECESDEI